MAYLVWEKVKDIAVLIFQPKILQLHTVFIVLYKNCLYIFMTNQIIWKIQSLHNQGKFIEKLAFLDILYMIWTFYRFLSLIFMKYVYLSFIHERILIEADKSFYRWYLSDKINFAKMI